MTGRHDYSEMTGRILASALLLSSLSLHAGCGSTQAPQTDPTDGTSSKITQEELEQPPKNGFLGLTFDSIDASPLIVKAAVSGSSAEKLGIVAGDQLVGLEDARNPSVLDIFQRLANTQPGEHVQILIRRNSVERKYEIELMSFDSIQRSMENQSRASDD